MDYNSFVKRLAALEKLKHKLSDKVADYFISELPGIKIYHEYLDYVLEDALIETGIDLYIGIADAIKNNLPVELPLYTDVEKEIEITQEAIKLAETQAVEKYYDVELAKQILCYKQ
jgi:hypothetical protein